MNVPIDDVHADCVRARADINRWFFAARLAASQWVPAPAPGTDRSAPTVPGKDRS